MYCNNIDSVVKHLLFLIISAPFMCPTCYAHGENAVSDCEANIEYKPCLENEKDPVCVLYNESKAPFYTIRYCRSREAYNVDKVSCQTSDRWMGCDVAMCETNGCKAEFPTSGNLNYLKHDLERSHRTALRLLKQTARFCR